MSVDYLGFEYRYNLIVVDNNKGFEWKPMSVCTESKVMFDKHKVIQYFKLFEIYINYENGIYNHEYYKRNYNSGYVALVENWKMKFKAKFFVRFVNIIFDDINIVELSYLIVNEKELFECSAKFHYKSQSIEESNDSNAIELENCFEYFEVNTTVIADNTFGICYEFFENNSSIVLKEEDFIKIIIKFEKQKDFIIDYFYQNFNMYVWYDGFHQSFHWYYFINISLSHSIMWTENSIYFKKYNS